MERPGTYARILFSVSCAFLLLLLIAPAGRADGMPLASPTGDLGSATHTYTLDGISVTAVGFNGGNLFGKKSGSDETGLGLTGDPTGDHEIFAKKSGAQDFIQLDLLNLINAGFTNVKFQVGSSEGGDQWEVTACSTAGVSGSGPCAANSSTLIGTDGALHLAPMNLSATNHYLDISATKGNVLVEDLQAFDPPPGVPEPSSYALLLAGMFCLASVFFVKRLATQKV